MSVELQINDKGYWIKGNLLSESECDHLIEALSDSPGHRSRAGVRHLMNHPAVASIASDPRLLNMARLALGGEAVPYRATLFEKSINAKWLVVWHQDRALPLEASFESPAWGPWSRKAGITYAHAPHW